MLEFSPDIWYLVFQVLDTQEDIRNVCEVSRSFHILAIPLLYRSVVFRASETTTRRADWDTSPSEALEQPQEKQGHCPLLFRLLDNRNERLRAFVRNVTFEENRYTSYEDRIYEKPERPNNMIAKLVEALPNLENVFFHTEYPLADDFIHAMCNHGKSPKLHLLRERGKTQVTTQMTCVHTLHIRVRDCITGWSRDIYSLPPVEIALHKLFAVCPNLQEISVQIYSFRTGCCLPTEHRSTTIEPLKLGENQSFPPLQKLSLSGYLPKEVEIRYWQDTSLWSRLKSLSLGPEKTHEFLKPITGCVQFLAAFKITTYSDPELDQCQELEDFLLSFGSLEVLTIKGYFPSVEAIGRHSNLRNLTLHTIEEPGRERPTLGEEGLKVLNGYCPHLESFELDVRRNLQWPKGPIITLASRFRNLRHVEIHVGLEIRRLHGRFKHDFGSHDGDKEECDEYGADWNAILDYVEDQTEKILTPSTARDFGQLFLDNRCLSSRVQKVFLNTGEPLRRFPQRPPGYTATEETNATSFEIQLPQNEISELVVTELDVRRYLKDDW